MAPNIFCKVTTPNGERCRAFADKDTGYCWWHDPATERQRQTASSSCDCRSPRRSSRAKSR